MHPRLPTNEKHYRPITFEDLDLAFAKLLLKEKAKKKSLASAVNEMFRSGKSFERFSSSETQQTKKTKRNERKVPLPSAAVYEELLMAVLAQGWMVDSGEYNLNLKVASIVSLSKGVYEGKYNPMILRFTRNESREVEKIKGVEGEKCEESGLKLQAFNLFDKCDEEKDEVDCVNMHCNELSLYVSVKGIWHHIEFPLEKDCVTAYEALSTLLH